MIVHQDSNFLITTLLIKWFLKMITLQDSALKDNSVYT